MKATHEDWVKMKKCLGITNKDVSAIIGATEGTVNVSTSPKFRAGLPKWAKLAIFVFNEMKQSRL